MAISKTSNTFSSTYKDDFADSDHYHRILFNSGRALQARELTQMQTIIQREIERFGKNIFKEGAAVNPVSNIKLEHPAYVKLQGAVPNLSTFVGLTFTGATSGVQATVKRVEAASGGDPATLYVYYVSTTDTDPTASPITFTAGEVISSGAVNATIASSNAFGYGTIAHCASGDFFVLGHFVFAEAQSITAAKYSNTQEVTIGFIATEDIVTVSDTNALYDNQGANPNLSSPGADRYRIRLTLVNQADIDPDDTFIPVALIAQKDTGAVETTVEWRNDGTSDYNKILDLMAERTYDESGNYTIRPFTGLFQQGDSNGELILQVESGEGYVRGYHVEPSSQPIHVVKSLTTETFTETASVATYGNYVYTDSAEGGYNTNQFQAANYLDLRNAYNYGGSTIGSTKVFAVEDAGSRNRRQYLFDTTLNDGYTFADVKSFGSSADIWSNIDSTRPGLYDVGNANLLFDLPYARPDFSEALQLDYVAQYYETGTTNGSGELTITAPSGSVFTTSALWIVTPEGGREDETFSVTGVGTSSATITSSYLNKTVYVHALVQYQNAVAVTKTLTNTSVSVAVDSDGDGLKFVSLSKADVFRVNTVTDAVTGDDLTPLFTFDNGQRDFWYEPGRMVLKNNVSTPTNNVSVDFDYFAWSGTGKYASAHSYYGQVNYDEIPYYSLSNGGGLVPLRDVLDFRSRKSDDGTSFSATGSYVFPVPYNTTLLEGDMSFYKSRWDRLAVLSTGELSYIYGAPSLVNPKFPAIPNNAMNLLDIKMNAGTLNEKDTRTFTIDNKRYTMRDIGVLDKRIKRNTEAISLSLLELRTSSYDVLDANGLDRTKSGFYVDNFSDNSKIDFGPQFLASIDQKNRELRPAFNEVNVDLNYDSVNSTNLVYQEGEVYLDYTAEEWIAQPKASGLVNVNPFNVINHVGQIILYPDNDHWIETETLVYDIIDQFSSGQLVSSTTTVSSSNIITQTLDPTEFIAYATRVDPNWDQWNYSWFGEETVEVQTESSVARSGGTVTGGGSTGSVISGAGITNDQVFLGLPNLSSLPSIVMVASASAPGETSIDINLGATPVFATNGVTTTTTTTTTTTISSTSGQRTRSQIYAPWMRSRIVVGKAFNLKPNTNHHLFMDNVKLTGSLDNNGGGLAKAYSSESTWISLKNSVLQNEYIYQLNREDDYPLANYDTSLRTDGSGTLMFAFLIPNFTEQFFGNRSKALRIRSGTKSIALFDVDDSRGIAATSQAIANFTSSGLKRTLTEKTTIKQEVNTQTDVQTQTAYQDPLAQTFLNDKETAVFVRSIDIYVGNKDTSIPLTLEIRPTVNGYPSADKRVRNGIKVLTPAEITTTADASTATTFTFDRLVRLEPKTEYAFVLISQSNSYDVWESKVGEFEYGSTTSRITTQPYLGSLFKSQNGRTWEPAQNEDLKFEINIANFATSGLSGEAKFVLNDISDKLLPWSRIVTSSGDSDITILDPGHGFLVGDNVQISLRDAGSISGDSADVGGIAYSSITGTRAVTAIDYSGYKVAADSAATFDTIGGDNHYIVSRNVPFNMMYGSFDILNDINTNSSGRVKTTSFQSLAGTETPYVLDGTFNNIELNKNNYFASPRVLANADIQSDNALAETIDLRLTLTSNNDYVTPVLYANSTSAHAVYNMIDYQDSASTTNRNVPLTWVSETTAGGGSAIARYLTRTVQLANDAVGLKIIVGANVPAVCDFDLYYKTAITGDDITQQPWVLITPDDETIPKNASYNSFYEYTFTPGGEDGTLSPFTQFKVKIVMHSTNSSYVPRFKDFRAIALTV